MIFSHVKRIIRELDARLTPLQIQCKFLDQELSLYRTYWWDETSPDWISAEILPYFSNLPKNFKPSVILDAGGSSGSFSLLAAKIFPNSKIICFEPSKRQRLLLRRNIALNNLQRQIQVIPEALWNSNTVLAFRSNGAVSGVKGINAALPLYLSFDEKVKTTTLDDWITSFKVSRIDLIKMDIEGAEIEALEGARLLLDRDKPLLLIQAYHERDGKRTFDSCESLVKGYGYITREVSPPSGFLMAEFCPDGKHTF